MGKMKYGSYDIVFQEVPDEIALALNITECPHNCRGCHSSHLAENYGHFVGDDIDNLINRYREYITCVCFMGGDQHMNDLRRQLVRIKEKYSLNTCI